MLRRIGLSSTSSGRALFQQLWLLSCLCCILLPLGQHCQAWILSSSATKRQGIWPGGLAFSIQTPQHRQDDLQVVSTPSDSRRSPVLQMAFSGRSGGDYSKGKQAANFNPSGKAAVTGDRPVMERNTMQSNKVSRPAPITGSISQLLESLEMMKKDHQIVRMVSAVKSFATENRDVNIANYLLPILMEIEDKLTPTILPELLWAMGLLGFTTYDRQHRVFITDMMIKLFQWQELTSRQYTTALGGIVKMHVKWYNTDDTFKKLIINQLKRVAVSFNSREISNTLHSFSKLGLMWNDIDKAAQSLLVESLMLNAQGLISMQGSMSLYSLGIMGFNLDQVVPVVRDHIQQVAILVLEENFQINAGTGRKISQQCSNVIYGLAKMNFRYDDFSPELKQLIEVTIQAVASYNNAQELAMTVYSLGITGAKWSNLQPRTQQILEKTLKTMWSQFLPQGVSSALYGLHLLQFRYEDVKYEPSFWTEVDAAMVRCFSAKYASNPVYISQAIANSVYALGMMNVDWSRFSSEGQNAIFDGACLTYPHLTSQEISIIIYGLGLMKAPFDELPNSMYDMIRQSIKRINNGNQEQELCSILHGLANMGAKWTRIPDLIRQEIVRLIADSGDIKALCIACTTYSLGMLECKWQELPDTVFDKLNTEVQRTKLVDQTLANTIYGLGLMDATWETMPNEFSAALLRMIFDPRSFDADVPQHITNTMWALGKMNFLWSFLPKTNLQEAFVRCAHQCNHQELANYFYGLSLMEASWSELSLETIQALEKQLKRNVDVLNSQEVANIMYAMPLLTFDFPFQQVANNPQEEAIRQGKLACMWTIHELLIKAYVPKHESSFSTENYDQFAAYFEWMSVLPGGYDLVMRYTDKYPIVSGPSATVPSRLHAHTVDALIDELQRSYSRKFEIFHEFSGLRGVFPIDSALYFDNELVALIEIDGDFHYQVGEQGEQQLRRKDFFKEALYKHWYPTLTTYRLKMDQITALGYTVAGTAAAHFIANDMMKHEKLVRDDHDQLCLADRNGINAAKAKATARKTTKPKSSEVSEEVASNVRKTKRSPKASIASDVEIEVMVDADSMSEPKKRGRKPKINT